MIAFVYLCVILFIIIFSIYLMKLSFKRCPEKIRIFYSIALTVLILRYLALLILWIVESQRIVYVLKSVTQLNFIGIPLLALCSLYIFFREEGRKFDYNYSFMFILAVMFIVINIFCKLDIKIDSIFGFVIRYKDILIPSLVYLIVLSSLVVFTLLYIDKPYSNSNGMRLLLGSLMIAVAENILFLGGIKIFPYTFFGEILILVSAYKSVLTFKAK